MDKLYRIKLSYAVFGIIVNNDIVIKAAPIAKWMIGKDIAFIRKWVISKRGEITNLMGLGFLLK